MKAEKLLSKYSLTAKVVKDWFLNKLIESMNTDDVPEDFKQAILDEGISDDRLGIIIDAQPRSLFDVFDVNDVIIQIIPIKEDKVKYLSRVNQFETPYDFRRPYFTRKEAELFAIEAAFEILENKLNSNEVTE